MKPFEILGQIVILKCMQHQMVFQYYSIFQMAHNQSPFFNSLDKSVEFFGDLDIQNYCNNAEVGNLITKFNLVK